MTRTRRGLTALGIAAVATSALAVTGAAQAATGNHGCPAPTVHRNTTGWTTLGAATVTLHPGQGVVLKTTASNDDKATWARTGYDVALGKVGQLSYQTETQTGHVGAPALPSYYLSVDVNDDGVDDTKLVYEPYYQVVGAPSGATTVWDVDGGKFWSNSPKDATFMAGWPLNEKAGGSYAGNKTLAEIGVLWPQAHVTGFGINLGTYNPGVNARVNDVKFGCDQHQWLPAPPTTSPSASASVSPSPSKSTTASPSASNSVSPSATASATASPSPTKSTSATPTPVATSPGVIIAQPVGNNDDDLPLTGSPLIPIIAIGAALAAAGAAAIVITRRRKQKFIA